MTEASPPEAEDDINTIVSLVLRARTAEDSRSRVLRAEVARAIRPETEHYAAEHLMSRIHGASESRRAGIFRAAALIAQYPRIPQARAQEPEVGGSGAGALAPTLTGESAAAQEASNTDNAQPRSTVNKRRNARLGGALSVLAQRSDNPEAMKRSLGGKLQVLPMLGREQAVQIIDGLLARLDNQGIPLDFYSLAQTVAYWETGSPEADRARRQRIIFDFFA